MSHTLWGTPTYHSWAGMKARCGNPNHIVYRHYGGKGIVVCERWNSFENFLEDMGIKPEDHTLDRIDGNGPYCKSNCRWATWSEQNHNKAPTKRNNSGIKGVSFDKAQQVWKARITLEGCTKTLYRGSLLEAAAYRKSWELWYAL